MLGRPKDGWGRFQLEGTSAYYLSYLDDIAFDWVEQAIHGLETMLPFCVEGFMEPNRFLCVVSYWNCHIICENDEPVPLCPSDVSHEYAHITMLQFCERLLADVSDSVDEWASFFCVKDDEDIPQRRERLVQRLDRLRELISERQKLFGPNRCFF